MRAFESIDDVRRRSSAPSSSPSCHSGPCAGPAPPPSPRSSPRALKPCLEPTAINSASALRGSKSPSDSGVAMATPATRGQLLQALAKNTRVGLLRPDGQGGHPLGGRRGCALAKDSVFALRTQAVLCVTKRGVVTQHCAAGARECVRQKLIVSCVYSGPHHKQSSTQSSCRQGSWGWGGSASWTAGWKLSVSKRDFPDGQVSSCRSGKSVQLD